MTPKATLGALPVDALREPVIAHWHNGGCLLQSPPGSGKTTRLPLWLLDVDNRETILLLPRRLPVQLAAQRLAEQLGEAVGEQVGYSLRHDTQRSAKTRLTVITYGAFLRRLQQDPELTGVGTVILDEFHERGLDQDVSLTLLHSCRDLFRPDLRLLVMSATLSMSQLEQALRLPTVESDGQLHPLTESYHSPGRSDADALLVELVAKARTDWPGHVLVFLPGLAEIERIRQRLPTAWPSCVVHSQVPQDDLHGHLQNAEPTVILSTNLAESSVTLPGVRAVVDSGLERYAEIDPATGLTELKTRRISKSSARQRAGRAARLGPGHCYRLWSHTEQDGLAPDQPPEIAQADLTSLVLMLADWGLERSDAFWLTPPTAGRWQSAVQQLIQWQALDAHQQLTDHGRRLIRLGLEPALAHLVVTGHSAGHGSDAAWLGALLSQQTAWPDASDDGFAQAVRHADRTLKREARLLAQRLGCDLSNSARLLPEPVLINALSHRLMHCDAQGRARLANGAAVQNFDAASDWQLLLHGRNRNGEVEIQQALPVAASTVRDALPEHSDIALASANDHSRFVRRRWLGPFLIDVQPTRADASEQRQAWQHWLADQPLSNWPKADVLTERLDRYRFASQLLDDWPAPPSAADLAHTVEPWLTGIQQLQQLDSLAVFDAWVGYDRAEALNRLCPKQWQAPSGRRCALHYEPDQERVTAALKLQEAFGLAQTPTLLDGRQPLTLALQAPNGRVLAQVNDLPHFWHNIYPEIRKEMRGRYNRHPWPEDPMQALATAATNRQLRHQGNSTS
ncbi:ATP-dependent helicase HrpB [Saccharospirillum sp. MSK14-1]|uniref:ATP-dependent helicase HrpB n=1 Tax=Saccharospirillum sp. MSK14-1 TaxID=1897632 RepID=UPI000D418F31|nr:ATP-dependent helicase HrpB [Saccharospirillum sp. MSK14-1]PTY36936.1 ATP-dependent helicase HrpB [Saccharospirillum sp. MSK14-1]